MRAEAIVTSFVDRFLAPMHQARRELLATVACAALAGSSLSLTRLARGVRTRATLKCTIRRVERLIGNARVNREAELLGRALIGRICAVSRTLVLAVDWSEASSDGRFVELRIAATWPGAGRAVSIYQQVHPLSKLGNARVERDVTRCVAQWIPAGIRVVALTDAGFRRGWMAMINGWGWSWIGRVRRGILISTDGRSWQSPTRWFTRSRPKPVRTTGCWMAKEQSVACALVSVRRRRQPWQSPTLASRDYGGRVRKRHAFMEPWLLAHSPDLATLRADEIVALYARRFQIEETFRDGKSARFGLGMEIGRCRRMNRIQGLMLIATLVLYLLWHLGQLAEAEGLHRPFKLTTRSDRELSLVTLGRMLCQTPDLLSQHATKAIFHRLGLYP